MSKRKMTNFWTQIIVWANILSKLNLTVEDWLKKNIFPNVPFFRKGSAKLIKAVKNRDVDKIVDLLNNNRFTVYDFDTVHQTALHWAAKRGYPEIWRILIAKGALVDAKDLGNRTPLLIASKMSNVRWVKVLLAHEANPSCRTFLGHTALELAATPSILSYLKKGYLLSLANNFINKADRKDVWKREALTYFENENDGGIPFLM